MDKETQEILTEQQKAVRLVANSDWQWAKAKLEAMISLYMSFDSLPAYTTATQLQKEIESRKKAVGVLRTWFEEVEGTSTQSQFNNIINQEDGLVARFEGKKE